MARNIFEIAFVLIILLTLKLVQPFSKCSYKHLARRTFVDSTLPLRLFNRQKPPRRSICQLQCSSVDKEALVVFERGKNKLGVGERKERFVHPQVYKMFHRAQYLIRQGNSTVAQKLLVRCLELNPYDSHSWLALGRLEAKLGNAARAREVFVEGMTKCPNNIHILHAWGLMEQVNQIFLCRI